MINYRISLLAGATSGLLAVMIGAFGAHALEPHLSQQMLQRYHTAVDYQFYHSLALLLTGILACQHKTKLLTYAGAVFAVGIVLFSGSLYVYALSGIRSVAIITPIGGLCFIIGWLLLLVAIIKFPANSNSDLLG